MVLSCDMIITEQARGPNYNMGFTNMRQNIYDIHGNDKVGANILENDIPIMGYFKFRIVFL